MKKKYFAPEMEEMKVETPTLLEASAETSTEQLCTDNIACDGDY
jgi:hypothetical protein